MRCLLPIAAAMLILCAAPAIAQTALPGMGMTSPLAGTGAVGPVGIPLGSTELDPGGLSPEALGSTTSTSPCGTTGSSGIATGMSGATASGSTFDGGGNIGVSGPCGSVAVGGTVSGTQSTSVSSGVTGGSTLGIGTIPLGVTELGSSGISPMLPGPAQPPTLDLSTPQTFNSSSCAGSATTPGTFGSGTSMGTTGISSPLGC
jgi:hypothetical protein